MELIRMGVVYLHLIACCIAIGMIFTSDLAMVRSLLTGKPNASNDSKHLTILKDTISATLTVLWLTGLSLVAIDVWDKGYEVLLNPKLQAKFAVVLLLTINGVLLHHAVLPSMARAGSLLRMSLSRCVLCVVAGTVSAVSWFYAALLGVGRPLNFKYSLFEILMAFPMLVAGGVTGMLLLVAWAQAREASMLHPSRAVA